jgi:VIT1/CCC1 family predicted Fe2+/Mn2+ transporter
MQLILFQGELKLEESHVENSLHRELEELDTLFPKIGITCENSAHVELHQTLKEFYRQHPRSLLNLMEALEFGFIEDEIRSPVIAGLFSCSLFVLGALPSILPFAFTRNTEDGLIAAAVATILSVLAVGAFKTWATRGKLFVAAIENLIITGLGGAMAYGVGILFDMLIK